MTLHLQVMCFLFIQLTYLRLISKLLNKNNSVSGPHSRQRYQYADNTVVLESERAGQVTTVGTRYLDVRSNNALIGSCCRRSHTQIVRPALNLAKLADKTSKIARSYAQETCERLAEELTKDPKHSEP